jgi:hypothetical protein
MKEVLLHINKMEEKKVYKIRDKLSGKFSTGGEHPKFNSVGKTWSTIHYLHNHLRVYVYGTWGHKRNQIPESWEIVEFTVIEKETGTKPINF